MWQARCAAVCPVAGVCSLVRLGETSKLSNDNVVKGMIYKDLLQQRDIQHPGYMDWAIGEFQEGSANGRLGHLAKYDVAGAHNASDFSLVGYRDLEISRKIKGILAILMAAYDRCSWQYLQTYWNHIRRRWFVLSQWAPLNQYGSRDEVAYISLRMQKTLHCFNRSKIWVSKPFRGVEPAIRPRNAAINTP